MGRRSYGKKSQNAATVITQMIEPWKDARTVLVGLQYNDLGTAHTLTIMRPLNATTFAADAAAGQAVVTLAADPGVYSANGTYATADNAISSGDFVVYEAADGTYVIDTAAASFSSGSATFTTNLPTGGVKAGGKVWFFGITTDTNPNNHQTHPAVLGGSATTTTTYKENEGFAFSTIPDAPGMKVGNGNYQPMIVHSNNATAAGTIVYIAARYDHPAAVGKAR